MVEGGLGLEILNEGNTRVLAKWLRRFPLEHKALWTKVISASTDLTRMASRCQLQNKHPAHKP